MARQYKRRPVPADRQRDHEETSARLNDLFRREGIIPTSIHRVSQGSTTVIGFSSETNGAIMSTYGMYLGDHWNKLTVFRKEFFLVFPVYYSSPLRYRMNDLRWMGIAPGLACKLVTDHYYSAG